MEAALDAVLAGIAFTGEEKPRPIAPLKLAAACPAGGKSAKLVAPGKSSAAEVLGAAISGFAIGSKKPSRTPLPEPAPRNGAVAMCVTGSVGPFTLIRPANPADGTAVFMPFGDAAQLLIAEPQVLGKGYRLKRYGIATVEVLGAYDSVPSAEQFAAILTDRTVGKVQIITRLKANGDTGVTIDPSVLK